MNRKLFRLLIPEDVGQGLKFLALPHVAAEEGDDLLEQLQRNQRQGRGEPGPDLLKVDHLFLGGEKLAQLRFSQLVDSAVAAGNQADGLLRSLRLLQRREHALIGRDALALSGDLGLHQAVRVLVPGLLQAVQEHLGPFDLLLDGADGGALGVRDGLCHLAVFHAPGDPLALGQLGEIVRLGDAELLEGLGGVRDVLPGAAVGKNRRFLKEGFRRGLCRRLFLPGEGGADGIVLRICGENGGRLKGLHCLEDRRCDGFRGLNRSRLRGRGLLRRRGLHSLWLNRRRNGFRLLHHHGFKGIRVVVGRSAAEDRGKLQPLFLTDTFKRETAVLVAHFCLLLSILGQKKTVTALNRQLRSSCPIHFLPGRCGAARGALRPFSSPFLPNCSALIFCSALEYGSILSSRRGAV